MLAEPGGNGTDKQIPVPVISLGDHFGAVVVKVNGVRIEVGSDGNVKVRPAANDDLSVPPIASGDVPRLLRAGTAPEIGDEMEDGTILAGYYKGKALYATPRDAPGTYTFNEAARYAKNLDAHGHHDFHAPSKGELNVLWENRNKGKLKGTFNETGSYPAGWYWSSSQFTNFTAWAQRLSDGYQDFYGKLIDSSLRCVR